MTGFALLKEAQFSMHHPFRSVAAKEQYLAAYDRLALRWPVGWDGVYVTTSFGRTFVRTTGGKGAPTLVMLPALGTTSQVWEPNLYRFAKLSLCRSLGNRCLDRWLRLSSANSRANRYSTSVYSQWAVNRPSGL